MQSLSSKSYSDSLEKSRKQQFASYDKGHKKCSPFETGQTVSLRRPKTWKFGRKWVGPYHITSRKGVNYNNRSTTGKSLVAHHDQLKPYPIQLDKSEPVYPALEMPGEVIREVPEVEQQRYNEARDIQASDIPRPINPPNQYGDIIVH